VPAGSALVLVGLRPTPNPTPTQPNGFLQVGRKEDDPLSLTALCRWAARRTTPNPNGSLQVGRKEDDPALRWGASSFFVPLLPLWGAYFRCRERAVREPLESR
jgi:hypothetical protein